MRKTTAEHKKYIQHRHDAAKRDIPFLLTFEEWWQLWQDSGKWDHYGCHKGQFCMARFGDKGAYEVGNVRICSTEENHAEWNDKHKELSGWSLGQPRPEAWRAKISAGLKGKPKSAAHCAAISAAKRAAPNLALIKRNKEPMLMNSYTRTAIGRQALLDYYLREDT